MKQLTVMHQILPETHAGFVALRLSAKLDDTDYQAIIPLLETRIAEPGRIALYWEMNDFEGWTKSGLWADMKFDLGHVTDFSRIALMGEERWQAAVATLMKPFTSAEVRYFDLEERAQALRWASGG